MGEGSPDPNASVPRSTAALTERAVRASSLLTILADVVSDLARELQGERAESAGNAVAAAAARICSIDDASPKRLGVGRGPRT